MSFWRSNSIFDPIVYRYRTRITTGPGFSCRSSFSSYSSSSSCAAFPVQNPLDAGVKEAIVGWIVGEISGEDAIHFRAGKTRFDPSQTPKIESEKVSLTPSLIRCDYTSVREVMSVWQSVGRALMSNDQIRHFPCSYGPREKLAVSLTYCRGTPTAFQIYMWKGWYSSYFSL